MTNARAMKDVRTVDPQTGKSLKHLEAAEEEVAGSGSSLVRESTLSYGAKFRISDQDRWIPRSVAIVQGMTPTSGPSNVTTSRSVCAGSRPTPSTSI